MYSDGSFTPWRFGCVHLACCFKCARDFDTEVAQDRRARLLRVMMLWPSVHSPGWPRMKSQTLLTGPQAEATAPGATSRRTAANWRG